MMYKLILVMVLSCMAVVAKAENLLAVHAERTYLVYDLDNMLLPAVGEVYLPGTVTPIASVTNTITLQYVDAAGMAYSASTVGDCTVTYKEDSQGFFSVNVELPEPAIDFLLSATEVHSITPAALRITKTEFTFLDTASRITSVTGKPVSLQKVNTYPAYKMGTLHLVQPCAYEKPPGFGEFITHENGYYKMYGVSLVPPAGVSFIEFPWDKYTWHSKHFGTEGIR